MKKKIRITIFMMLFACITTFAQMNNYAYKNRLPEVIDTWHTIRLPDEMFSKISPDLSDIRVFGITTKNDTVEAPYLLQLKTEKVTQKTIPFTTLNTTFNEKGTYTTLEIPAEEPINQIQLDFEQPNFDWMITLEGSQDNKEWYTITKDYRILSIKNEHTNYKFTTIRFPEARYRYFRILIKDTKKPVLETAKVIKQEVEKADYREYDVASIDVKKPKNSKSTIIDVTLTMPVPVSYIQINVEDKFDYYRPISIRYATDSIQTQQGNWRLNYRQLSSGILNSIEENSFSCASTIAQKFRVVIDNQDNQPLNIGKVILKGYQHELVTRFTNPATYYLVYGNNKARKPSYDLNYVSNKIPNTMTALSPGMPQHIDKEKTVAKEPLFINKIWLWAIMGIVIVVLGGFTLSMMKKEKS